MYASINPAFSVATVESPRHGGLHSIGHQGPRLYQRTSHSTAQYRSFTSSERRSPCPRIRDAESSRRSLPCRWSRTSAQWEVGSRCCFRRTGWLNHPITRVASSDGGGAALQIFNYAHNSTHHRRRRRLQTDREGTAPPPPPPASAMQPARPAGRPALQQTRDRRLYHHPGVQFHSVKVKFSHTRYRALGPELIPVYWQSARR